MTDVRGGCTNEHSVGGTFIILWGGRGGGVVVGRGGQGAQARRGGREGLEGTVQAGGREGSERGKWSIVDNGHWGGKHTRAGFVRRRGFMNGPSHEWH